MSGEQAWGAAPQLQNLRPAIQQLREMLRGRLEFQDGVAVQTQQALRLNMRLVGDVIHVQFEEPMPQAEVQYVFHLLRAITGLTVTDSKLAIQIQGLPDPSFDIIS